MHYARWYRHGDVNFRPSAETKTCSIDECDGQVEARDWCLRHYSRWYKHGDVNWQPAGRTPCSIDGCDKPISRKGGFCAKHGRRFQVHGDPSVVKRARGPEHPRWKGEVGRYVNRAGYIRIYDPVTQVIESEHRLVMAEVLGRRLFPDENVHHKNGVRDDNRPENLELWVTSQPAGKRPDDLLAWADEIIRRYR